MVHCPKCDKNLVISKRHGTSFYCKHCKLYFNSKLKVVFKYNFRSASEAWISYELNTESLLVSDLFPPRPPWMHSQPLLSLSPKKFQGLRRWSCCRAPRCPGTISCRIRLRDSNVLSTFCHCTLDQQIRQEKKDV